MRTRDSILQNVAKDIKEVEDGRLREGHTDSFWKQYLNILKRFHLEIENTILFTELEEYWCYSYEIAEQGAKLYLQYIAGVDCDEFDEDGEPISITTDVAQSFELVTVPAKLLSVEDYATAYDVSVTTVRQWIRRGKIRSAIKSGREWSIPELAEVSGRGYQSGLYHLTRHLNELPEEFSFLSKFEEILIQQSEENKDVYNIYLYCDATGERKELQMSTAEKERLELMLISHPLVTPHIKPIFARS